MRSPVANPLAHRLEQYARLSPEDRAALDLLASGPQFRIGARQDIIMEGERPSVVRLILEGWACRYKVLPDGRRQIIALFLPGDLCDLHVYVLRELDHSIGTLTEVRYVEITRERIDMLTTHHPRVTQALWWDALVSAAIQREWTVNLGQRDAIERMAHLLCEVFFRLRAVKMTTGNSCWIPLTQNDLAEVTGMTPVHVNRTVKELRNRGLIAWKGREFEMLDLDAMCTLAMFNANYLHADHEGAHLDANATGMMLREAESVARADALPNVLPK